MNTPVPEWLVVLFASIGLTATILLICWVLAGIWVKVFPR